MTRHVLLASLALLAAAPALAQAGGGAPLPQKHIPPSVLMELRALEQQFDQSLVHDCAPERCVSKGCVYRDHAVVDLPRSASLPGLGHTEGPGSVPAQEYLIDARCDFGHEKSVSAHDVQVLVRRLEARLSKGWLKVTVSAQQLEPISPALAESPPPKPQPEPKKVEPPPTPAPAPQPPQKWEAELALRELWVTLLPHFAWMIAVLLGTLATLSVIWGWRRLGRESIEEKAMLAELAAGKLAPPEEAKPEGEPEGALPKATEDAEGSADTQFVSAQGKLWADRIAEAELAKDESVVVDLLREWLKAGEFRMLAKAILVFGDRLSLAFPSDGELAVRKVELAEYLKNLDQRQLPSDAEFFHALNRHAISSSLLAQSDAEVYRSLREEFGATGLVSIIEGLPARHGALLFSLAPPDVQQEVARQLAPAQTVSIAGELLASNRIAKEERAHLFAALEAARAGKPLPPAPAATPEAIADRGQEFDAAGALSVLLQRLGPLDRKELLATALARAGGALPAWHERILYPDMLEKLPAEQRTDLLLEVDPRGLAGWVSLQPAAWQEAFLAQQAASLRSALRANLGFTSRAEQLEAARRGHEELAGALKRLVAQGRGSFAALMA
jgi:hypothetical protein